jgi:hypothetical protein
MARHCVKWSGGKKGGKGKKKKCAHGRLKNPRGRRVCRKRARRSKR